MVVSTRAGNAFAALASSDDSEDAPAESVAPATTHPKREKKRKRKRCAVSTFTSIGDGDEAAPPAPERRLKRKRRRVTGNTADETRNIDEEEGSCQLASAPTNTPPKQHEHPSASAQPSETGTKRTLPGGVVTEVTRAALPGSPIAKDGLEVKLNYVGYLPNKDMKRFDRGDIDYVVGDGSMIRGFDAGVVGMAVGEKRTIKIPSKMGYGKKGKKPKVPPHSDLVMDVVLVQCGIQWNNNMKYSSMSQDRREAAKRRGKKPKSS